MKSLNDKSIRSRRIDKDPNSEGRVPPRLLKDRFSVPTKQASKPTNHTETNGLKLRKTNEKNSKTKQTSPKATYSSLSTSPPHLVESQLIYSKTSSMFED